VSLLEVQSLDQFYRDFQALYGISLTVEEGETVAIIGANGAGKSTFLMTVAGLLRSATGSIRFDGEPIAERAAYERVRMGIAMVPEGRRIFPSLSVQENLQVGGYRKVPGPWTLDRVYELFPLLGRLARRPAAVLSGGEQQALAIGRALAANPRLLLMDEISLGLAPVVVKQLYASVPVIVSQGTSLVLVEQNVTQALRIADRAYCLLEGRISLHGRPSELSRDQITAAYFGM
jgi:branched-chain amino acid transport system ATP-binding protein